MLSRIYPRDSTPTNQSLTSKPKLAAVVAFLAVDFAADFFVAFSFFLATTGGQCFLR